MVEKEYKLIDKWIDFFINKVRIKNNLLKLSNKKLLVDIDLNELFYKLKINILDYDQCQSYLIKALEKQSFETILDKDRTLIVIMKKDNHEFDLKEYLYNKSVQERLNQKLLKKEAIFFFIGSFVILLFSYFNQDLKLILALITLVFFVDSIFLIKEWLSLQKYLKSFYVLEL